MRLVPDASAYLILNSDTWIYPGFVERIMEALERHPEAGVFVPWLEWEDGTPQENCFRMHSPLTELIRGAASGPVTRLLNRHELVLEVPPDADDIQWASFACVLLRGEMVRQIGPMDEGYFMYFEDAEYCMRARKHGWAIRFAPLAKVVHYEGGSGPVQALDIAKDRLPIYYWRSRTRYLQQAYGRFGLLAGNLGWYGGRAIAHLRLFAGKRVPTSRKLEWRDIWTDAVHSLLQSKYHR
jgi:GT2 family glycosyltransferase